MKKIVHDGKIVGHLIPANLEHFNFSDLVEEYEKRGYILWRNGLENGKRARDFKKGEICYFYYTNLPDYSKRVLLKGEILDNTIYDNEKKIKGIKIVNICSVSLKDEYRFSLINLKKQYEIVNMQSHRYLRSERDKKLIEDLHEYVEENTTLQDIKLYFNDLATCFFSDDKELHPTFVGANGFKYFERHHFVQGHIGKTYPILKYDLDNNINLFSLCPKCHREIHHGQKKVVKNRIKKMYQTNEKWYEEKFGGTALKEGYNSTLEWIYAMYNLD